MSEIIRKYVENDFFSQSWKDFPEEEPHVETDGLRKYYIPCLIKLEDGSYTLWRYYNDFWYGTSSKYNIGRPKCKFIQLVVDNEENTENNDNLENND